MRHPPQDVVRQRVRQQHAQRLAFDSQHQRLTKSMKGRDADTQRMIGMVESRMPCMMGREGGRHNETGRRERAAPHACRNDVVRRRRGWPISDTRAAVGSTRTKRRRRARAAIGLDSYRRPLCTSESSPPRRSPRSSTGSARSGWRCAGRGGSPGKCSRTTSPGAPTTIWKQRTRLQTRTSASPRMPARSPPRPCRSCSVSQWNIHGARVCWCPVVD